MAHFPQNDSLIFDMNELGRQGEPFLFIIDYLMKEPLLLPLSKAAKHDIWFNINGITNFTPTNKSRRELQFKKYPVQYEQFKTAFDKVVSNISYGNSFLTNLTFPTPVETNYSLDEIFEYSEAPYKLLFKDKFVVFSPEIFVKITNQTISSFPMKGTINAQIEDAARLILNDPKEVAEHHTIVDLIRNDLSIVASDVHVKRFRYIDEVVTHEKKLLQVSSEITGTLDKNFSNRIGDIIVKLLPAGSICGAPKHKTLDVIEEAENYQRGYYTGVFGIFDGKALDSAVMIRFIEQQNGKMIFKSGGGITAFSQPEREYNELIDKVYVPIN
jgi:para-aminobenzoate synthetase component 1